MGSLTLRRCSFSLSDSVALTKEIRPSLATLCFILSSCQPIRSSDTVLNLERHFLKSGILSRVLPAHAGCNVAKP